MHSIWAQPHCQKRSTVGPCIPFSCFWPCLPPVHNAIMQSISWQIHQLLHLRTLWSLITHVNRASVSTANLQNAQGISKHLAGNSHFTRPLLTSMELKLADHALPCVLNPLHRRVRTMAHRSAPATCCIQRQQRAESDQMDGEKSMRGANIYKPRGGGSVFLTALNSASDGCCSVSNLPLPSSLACQILPRPPLFHPLPWRTVPTALRGGLKPPKGGPNKMRGLLCLNTLFKCFRKHQSSI